MESSSVPNSSRDHSPTDSFPPVKPEPHPETADRRTFFSSWGFSIFFHAVVLIILTLTITQAVPPPKGLTEEKAADVGIAFRTQDDEKVLYESAADVMADEAGTSESSDSQPEDTSKKTDSEVIAELSSAIAGESSPEIPDLASLAPGLAPASGDGSTGLERVTDGLGNVTGVGPGTFKGFGKGKISCFGTSGEGSTFVFVFDRSASMGFHPADTAETPMKAAKIELRRSLRTLQSNQQFQIIFYNGLEEDLLQFEKNRLLFASRENVVAAERFLASIVPLGGTDHRTALNLALRQHPDVIFFLTDADENETTLNSADLERIRKNSAGTQINAIQFGNGPNPQTGNWLAKLAEQSGGQYVYLDVNQLNRR